MEAFTVLLENGWESYKAPDSLLPLLMPLTVWISAYLYSLVKGFNFAKWTVLHNLHNFGAIGLGLVSLIVNDETIFPERIPVLWSIGYFMVDIVECSTRLDGTYLLHGLFCLILGSANYHTPLLYELRMNSKASLCELSNPFMHLAKKTRKPLHFLLFFGVFTLMRIVWIPIMSRQLLERGIAWTDPRFLCLGGFYGLNCFWYFKMIKILMQGSNDKKEKGKDA